MKWTLIVNRFEVKQMKDKTERLIDDLVIDRRVTKAQKNLCNEALFWFDIAQTYIKCGTLSALLEVDSIISCVEKMRITD